VAEVAADSIPCRLLIDTGAQISLISRAVSGVRGLGEPECRIRGITGRHIRNYGERLVSLKMQDFTCHVKMQVVDDVGEYEGILGLDFLSKYGGVVDVAKRTLRLGRREIALRAAGRVLVEPEIDSVRRDRAPDAGVVKIPVRLAKSEVIPPRSERILRVKLTDERVAKGCVFLAEPNILQLEGCAVARSVGRITEGNEIALQIANFGEGPLQLHKGTCLATLHELGENEEPEVSGNASTPVNIIRVDGKINFEEKLCHLEDVEQRPLLRLLREFEGLFCESELPPATDLMSHRIPTGNAPPIYRRHYRVPHHQKALIDNFIEEQLRAGVIVPSESPWASPVVVVPKKSADGKPKFRFCVDFRALNAVTTPDVYPLPNIAETLDYLGNSRYFSTLDLTAGYYQIPIHPESQPKTAFNVHSGHYEYTRMPFGLRNAPSSFQRLMDGVLRGLKPSKCLVYLDDVVVFGATMEEHTERLRDVFIRLKQAKLSLKLEKCNFALEEVKYLGHIIGREGIKPDPDNLRGVESFPIPNNVKEVQSFLGLANYYRRFVDDYAAISRPLTRLMKKGVAFSWTPECEEAMAALKKALTTSPVLAYPNFGEPFTISTDASNFAIGAVLSQEIGGVERPIAYASRQLNTPEVNYSTTEKELLAVVWAIGYFRCYVYGRKFKIITDHAALKWLFGLKDPSGRLMRWTLKLSEYDYTVDYKPGKLHQNADALSRKVRRVEILDACDLRSLQCNDEECEGLVGKEGFEIRDGMLCKNEGGGVRVVVPKRARLEILRQNHDHPGAGHLGVKATRARIKDLYWWPGWKRDCENYVYGCVACQQRSPYGKTKAPLHPLPAASEPFEFIALDVVGPLPKTNRGNRYVLSILDHFSRYLVMVPLADQTAETVSVALVRDWVLKFGVPCTLLTDQGSNFTSELFLSVARLLRVKKLRTSPFHPQCNGRVERVHRTISQIMSHYVNCSSSDWDEWVDYAVTAYNTSWHSSVKFSPHEIVYGRKMRGPFDCALRDPSILGNPYVSRLNERLRVMWEKCRSNSRKAQKMQAQAAKPTVRQRKYKVGDFVYLSDPAVKVGGVKKFHKPWKGPYQVIQVLPPSNLKLQLQHRSVIVHQNRVKPHPTHLSLPPPPRGERKRGRPRKNWQTLEVSNASRQDEYPHLAVNARPQRSDILPVLEDGEHLLPGSPSPPTPPFLEDEPGSASPPATSMLEEEEDHSPRPRTHLPVASTAGEEKEDAPGEYAPDHPYPTPLPQRSPYALRSRGPVSFSPTEQRERQEEADNPPPAEGPYNLRPRKGAT
jgi:hypothetical protein